MPVSPRDSIHEVTVTTYAVNGYEIIPTWDNAAPDDGVVFKIVMTRFGSDDKPFNRLPQEGQGQIVVPTDEVPELIAALEDFYHKQTVVTE